MKVVVLSTKAYANRIISTPSGKVITVIDIGLSQTRQLLTLIGFTFKH